MFVEWWVGKGVGGFDFSRGRCGFAPLFLSSLLYIVAETFGGIFRSYRIDWLRASLGD